jgi:flagellar assembly factor FliW
MKIESPLFGTLEVSEEKIIEFPVGMPGFEQCHRFTLVHEESAEPHVFLLQSIEEPDIALSITPAANLGLVIEFGLTDEEVEHLQLKDPADALVTVIVRKAETDENSPEDTGLRANYMAPVIINVNARRGLQKVITRMGCEIVLRAEY